MAVKDTPVKNNYVPNGTSILVRIHDKTEFQVSGKQKRSKVTNEGSFISITLHVNDRN